MRKWLRPVASELVERAYDGRRFERFPVPGSARLLIDAASGPDVVIGDVLDMSEGGVALRIYRPLREQVEAQLILDFPGASLTVPVVTKWCHADGTTWALGVEFARLGGAKRSRVRRLLAARPSTA